MVSQISYVFYLVKKSEDAEETSKHLAHLEQYCSRERPPAPEFDQPAEHFPWKLPLPQVDRPEETKRRIDRCIIGKVVSCWRSSGKK